MAGKAREGFIEIRNPDFQYWVAREKKKAKGDKSIDLRKLVADYRAAVRQRDAAYAKAEAEGLSMEEWDALVDEHETPMYRMEIRAEAAVKRLHGIDGWTKDVGLAVDGALVVYGDPGVDGRTYASTTIVLPENVLAVDDAGEAGTIMRLDRTEVAMVEAYRNRGATARPVVIGGFKEPRTIAELVEVVRTFLDVNFQWCIDEYPPEQNRLDIQEQYGHDELRATSIFFCESNWIRGRLDALTPEEAEALKAFREGKTSTLAPKSPARKPANRLLKEAPEAAAGEQFSKPGDN